eukprot:g3247.t1
MAYSQSALTQVRVAGVGKISTRASRSTVRCQAGKDEIPTRRQLLGVGLLFAATATSSARADLIEDLKARSEANKELNDRKRLATSGANFARSRTVQDGTCEFPSNFFGCDVKNVAGNVKYITDDIELECNANEPGKCTEVPNMFKVGS